MEPYLGQLLCVGFNFAPKGWYLCDGRLLSIAQNTALFSLLGTIYGGDGTTTFALPDLRGRAALHFGQGPHLSNFTQGEASGSESVTLLVSNLPAHTHPLAASSGAGVATDPSGEVLAAHGDSAKGSGLYASSPNAEMSPAIGVTGGSQPFPIAQPYQTINWIIAAKGVFPPRSNGVLESAPAAPPPAAATPRPVGVSQSAAGAPPAAAPTSRLPAGYGRLSWRNAAGEVSLWTIDEAGRQVSSREHGPFAGWTPLQYADGWLLWRHRTGKASLWRIDEQGGRQSAVEHEIGPGWTPVGYASQHLLWRHDDSRVALWQLDDAGSKVAEAIHGPLPGWTALNYANGRILWRATDQRISLWRVEPNGRRVSAVEHGPFAGWTPIAYAAERILWCHTDGRISLWRVDADGRQVGGQEHGPIAGWTGIGLSGDRVLWRHTDGRISLWRVDQACRNLGSRDHTPRRGWTILGYGHG